MKSFLLFWYLEQQCSWSLKQYFGFNLRIAEVLFCTTSEKDVVKIQGKIILRFEKSYMSKIGQEIVVISRFVDRFAHWELLKDQKLFDSYFR